MSARDKVLRALLATPGVLSDVALARYGVSREAAKVAVYILRLMGHKIDRANSFGYRMVLAARVAG